MIKYISSRIKSLLLMLMLIAVCAASTPVFADQIKLSLKDVGADKDVELKTVKTYRDFYFTKPDHWKMNGTTKLIVTFQHSPQLLPERSSLNVLINDQAIKTIQLNPGNSTKTTVSIPIPTNILKDFNKLTFDVDQHYTYKCEDPFDPALWTTVLNTSIVELDYARVTPKTDLALFPYPLYDKLEYGAPKLNFVVPSMDKASDLSLNSMAVIAASIAQSIGWKPIDLKTFNQNNIDEKANLILVGTPDENPAISRFSGSLPLQVSGGKWTGESGGTITDDSGVLIMVPNPKNPTNTILIVSGNSPQGVMKAATVLSQYPTKDILKGQKVVINKTFANELSESRDWPQYISKKDSRLIDVKFDSQTVRGVTSVPIKYDLKIMPDMSLPPKNFAKMNLVYSYAANLDPEMSKLEVILNGVSLHSVKLNNTDGENLKTLDLDIPTEQFKTYNDLRFRFFIFPIKYDLCRFTTDAHVWGTIHNTTSLKLPAQIKTVVPDVGLVNDGGYPFTAYPDLQDDTIVLADNATDLDVNAMLMTVVRLSKMMDPTAGINIKVARVSKLAGEEKNSDNLIAIGTKDRNKLIEELKADLHMLFDGNVENFKKNKEELSQLKNYPNLGVVEQLLSPWNSNRVVMVLYGQNDEGLKNAISLFADDKKFESIERGNLVGISNDNVKSVVTLSKGQAKQLYGEEVQAVAKTSDFWINIAKIFLMVVGVLAILRIIFGAFIRGGRGQG